jgi:hypothetical protein
MSIDFPKEEEAIIQKWREIDAFRRQVCLLQTSEVPSSRALTEAAATGRIVQRSTALHVLRWPTLCDWASSLWSPSGLDDQGYHPPLLVYEGVPR